MLNSILMSNAVSDELEGHSLIKWYFFIEGCFNIHSISVVFCIVNANQCSVSHYHFVLQHNDDTASTSGSLECTGEKQENVL